MMLIFFYTYRLKQAKELRETLVEKLKIATESTLSAEERAARMDELLEDEDKRQKEIDYQLKYLRDMQFKKMQELHDNRTEERNTEAEIQVGLVLNSDLGILYFTCLIYSFYGSLNVFIMKEKKIEIDII